MCNAYTLETPNVINVINGSNRLLKSWHPSSQHKQAFVYVSLPKATADCKCSRI